MRPLGGRSGRVAGATVVRRSGRRSGGCGRSGGICCGRGASSPTRRLSWRATRHSSSTEAPNMPETHLMFEIAIGVMFAESGAAKLRHHRTFVHGIRAYGLVPDPIVRGVAWIIAAAEL